MTKLTSVSRVGHLGYRMTLPLRDGVTIVTGNNAAGKSMLAATIPDVFFDQSKLTAGSTLGVSWENNGVPASCFVQAVKGKTSWRCMEDNQAQEIRLKGTAKAWLKKRMPLSYSAFSTVNYISALRSGTILSGNATQCNELLADIVGLTVFDTLRKAMSAIYDREGLTAEIRSRLQTEIDALQPSVSSFRVIPKIDEKLATLQSRKATIRERAERLGEQLDTVRPLAHESDAALKQIVKDGEADLQAWQDFDEYEAAPKPRPLDVKRLELAREIYTRLNAHQLPYIWEVVYGKHVPPRNRARALRHATALQDRLSHLRVSVSHLKGAHDNDKCPTCNGKINRDIMLRTMSKELRRVEGEIAAAVMSAELATAANRIDSIQASLKVSPEGFMALVRDLDELEDAAQHNRTCDFNLKKVKRPKTARPDVNRIDDAKDELALREKGFVMATDDAEKQYDTLAASHEKLSHYIRSLSDYREQQLEFSASAKRFATVSSELDQLPETEDVELIREMLKALESKNARNPYLEMVGAHLVAMLNEHSQNFYSYPVEFDWQAGALIANRKGAAANVSTFSGHESRVFMLLMAVSTQLCLPIDARLRTLVLDEIEAGSQASNRHALAELLPTVLDNGYDNLLVVTPQSFADFPVHGSRYRVEADKTLSRIE